jgi:hypothetical protein
VVLKFLCTLGLHDWGPWEYESPDSCTQVRVCRRNGHKHPEERVNHDWGPWEYEFPENCTQVRVCRRGYKHQEQRTSHDWEEIERDEAEEYMHGTLKVYVTITYRCKRCGETKVHTEKDWY